MEAVVQQIRVLADKAGNDGRRAILDALRSLQWSLETPPELLNRLMNDNIEIAMVRLGLDLKIYQELAASEEPLTIKDLATKNGATTVLLGRVLRYLASIGTIKETGKDAFAANDATRTLAKPHYGGAIYHFFDTVGPCMQSMPDFLKESKYQDVSSVTNTPFQKAHNTPLEPFVWLNEHPRLLQNAGYCMMTQLEGLPPWFTVFPFERELGAFSGDTVMVDVGGGMGHQCSALLAAHPSLAGKLVLEDRPETVEMAQLGEGIRKLGHDFFQPQPIKGAKFYYLRSVIHDWPDSESLQILGHLKAAMGPDSQILLDEMLLPNTGVHSESTAIDITMMTCMGARERTVDDWNALLDAAGLRILRTTVYEPRRCMSIIQIVPK